MNRIDRLLGMTTFLQSKKFCTAEQLSCKFEISVRTVYRDVKALNEIGVPVHFENGKGYYISQGYFLPPLSLTIEEANALILLHSLAEKFADKSIVAHGYSALTKIRSVLKTSDKDKAEDLTRQINVYTPQNEKTDTKWLASIQKAIANKTALQIQYTDNHGKESKREIEPAGLIFYTYQWHVYAWCRQQEDYRDFKVNMIRNLYDTEKPHVIKNHDQIQEYIKSF